METPGETAESDETAEPGDAVVVVPGETEKVGILVVHGIGEQGRLDHLHSVGTELVPALEADETVERAAVTWDTSSKSDDFDADRQPDKPPLTIAVFKKSSNPRVDGAGRRIADIEIGLREVWYADLQEPFTMLNRVRFWLWGFSMWRFNKSTPPTDVSVTFTCRPGSAMPANPTGWQKLIYRHDHDNRYRLFGVAIFFVPTILFLSGLDWVLKRVGIGALNFTTLTATYLSDVKRYQQKGWLGGTRLPDPHQPPHVWVRRRMVRGIAAMGRYGYDRWYLLAHSLGTVVAHNGLSETSHRLPHYLDAEDYAALQSTKPPIARALRPKEPLPDRSLPANPRRPAWLQPGEIVDRVALFKPLRLFLTYGSPLDKFATMWPDLVRVNKEDQNIEVPWINLYDPRDPVAAPLDAFEPERWPHKDELPANAAAFKPFNVGYIASPIILLNHIKYLSFGAQHGDRLVNRLAKILIDPNLEPSTSLAAISAKPWMEDAAARKRTKDRFWQWLALFVGFLLLLHGLRWLILDYFLEDWALSKWLRQATEEQSQTVAAWLSKFWTTGCEQSDSCSIVVHSLVPALYPFAQTFLLVTVFSLVLVFSIGMIRVLHKHVLSRLWPQSEL